MAKLEFSSALDHSWAAKVAMPVCPSLRARWVTRVAGALVVRLVHSLLVQPVDLRLARCMGPAVRAARVLGLGQEVPRQTTS